MYMGGQEMKKVLERDNITIQENLQKVTKTHLYTSLYSAATSQYWTSTWNMKTCFLELWVDGLPVMCSFHLLSCIQTCLCSHFQLIFYYGATDHWCPVQYYHDIKKDFPRGDFRLCENSFRHAFVLDAGRDVAKMVVEWIRGDLRTWLHSSSLSV